MIDKPRLGTQLFRAHVAECAKQFTAGGHRRVKLRSCEPEVGDPQIAGLADHEVRRFDVPVDDPVLVGVVQSLGRLGDPRGETPQACGVTRRAGAGLCGGHASGGIRGPRIVVRRGFASQLLQGRSLDQLHHVEVQSLFAADREDRHDVGMVQLGGGQSLVFEAHQLPFVEHRGERQHLERDATLERDLLGFVDDAHPAATQFALDRKVAQATGHRRIRRGVAARLGLVQQFDPGQILRQLDRVARVLSQEGVAARRLAPFQRRQIGFQNVGQFLVTAGLPLEERTHGMRRRVHDRSSLVNDLRN